MFDTEKAKVAAELREKRDLNARQKKECEKSSRGEWGTNTKEYMYQSFRLKCYERMSFCLSLSAVSKALIL